MFENQLNITIRREWKKNFLYNEEIFTFILSFNNKILEYFIWLKIIYTFEAINLKYK